MTGMDDPNYEDRFIVLPVHLLAQLIHQEVKAFENVKIYWNHKFISLHQTESKAIVTAESEGHVKCFSGDFVVGSDGAGSEVRKALFGKSFPGRSWDVQIVATNV